MPKYFIFPALANYENKPLVWLVEEKANEALLIAIGAKGNWRHVSFSNLDQLVFNTHCTFQTNKLNNACSHLEFTSRPNWSELIKVASKDYVSTDLKFPQKPSFHCDTLKITDVKLMEEICNKLHISAKEIKPGDVVKKVDDFEIKFDLNKERAEEPKRKRRPAPEPKKIIMTTTTTPPPAIQTFKNKINQDVWNHVKEIGEKVIVEAITTRLSSGDLDNIIISKKLMDMLYEGIEEIQAESEKLEKTLRKKFRKENEKRSKNQTEIQMIRGKLEATVLQNKTLLQEVEAMSMQNVRLMQLVEHNRSLFKHLLSLLEKAVSQEKAQVNPSEEDGVYDQYDGLLEQVREAATKTSIVPMEVEQFFQFDEDIAGAMKESLKPEYLGTQKKTEKEKSLYIGSQELTPGGAAAHPQVGGKRVRLSQNPYMRSVYKRSKTREERAEEGPEISSDRESEKEQIGLH